MTQITVGSAHAAESALRATSSRDAQPAAQLASHPASQPTSQPTSQLDSQLDSQRDSHPTSQLASLANPPPASPATPAFDCDIVIVGAGPVGLALASDMMRRSATATLSVILLDARDAAISAKDPRVLALSHGSRVLLEPLGWSQEVTPIEKIHISQRGHFGRAEIDRHEHKLPALGYVARYGAITRALHAGFDRLVSKGGRAQLRENCAVTATRQDPDGVTVQFMDTAKAPMPAASLPAAVPVAIEAGSDDTGSAASGDTTAATPATPSDNIRQLRARLVIYAEGGLSAQTPAARAIDERRSRDYGQTALVGAVRCSAPLPRVAWERFTSEGPIALLPLAESGAWVSTTAPSSSATPHRGAPPSASVPPQRPCDYALVWCQRPENADRRLTLSDAAFLAELDVAFGGRVGHFTHIEGRARFPLGLQSRTTLVDGLTAAIGNAAQTLHPVAGQGLNLGLRDSQALATALAQHGPTAAALTDFAARRRMDRAITIGLTDSLARGFTVDFPPLAALRGLALAALDFLPATKAVLARQMMFGQRR